MEKSNEEISIEDRLVKLESAVEQLVNLLRVHSHDKDGFPVVTQKL